MIDFTAQLMLIYRCWIIWDKRWVVVAVPGSFAFLTLCQGLAYIGLTGIILPNKYSGKRQRSHYITHWTKILLTSRGIHPAQGSSNLHRSLRIIAAMLIESGLLMFTFQLAFVIVFSLRPGIVDIIASPTGQIYGITPTLLNIRVTMGTAYEKTTEKTASLRFAHSERATTQVTGTSISATGVQFRSVGTESDDASNNERVSGDAV
ncbi:hypothetical protein BD779DRAFT_1678229 [Infundibulicybe gibba]|nr:hypothetical protein BD779DRAFT_1678229 [Infundibulicybe gibba]